MDITLKIMEIDKNYNIVQRGKKRLYNTGKNAANKWCKIKIDKTDCPQLSSAINVRQEGGGKMCKNSIGYMNCNGNNVYYNQTLVGLYSSGFGGGGSGKGHSPGFPFTSLNFKKVIALFAARKTIKRDWINWQDEYLIPNTEHPDYEQWNNDAIVYSLFNSKSNQSSLRNIEYKNKIWNIINHFFFMSTEEMLELANKYKFNEMYQDAKAAIPDDRYVYTLLETTSLSNDSKAVLEAARELIRKSMIIRKVYHQNNPQYHLNCFDAGFAQIKPLLKEFYKEEYDAFVKMYKDMENRLREGVYKFGFLLK